jgi:CRP-like cAMP-binding protein
MKCVSSRNMIYPYAITALTDVTVCRVKSSDAENLLLSNPAMVPRIFASIFDSITAVDAYTNMLVMRSVYERIKTFSLLMVECLGRTGKDIKITLTHNELAYLIKANRVTVTKVLSQLEDEGFIERGNKCFTLLADKALGI